MRSLQLALVVATLALAMPGVASATTYYADDGGSAVALSCPFAAPCTLERAAQLATTNGDDIAVLPGTQVRANNVGYLSIDSNVTIHGIPGMGRPTIMPPSAISGQSGTLELNAGATARDINVTYPFAPAGGFTPAGIVMYASAHLDGVSVVGTSDAVHIFNGSAAGAGSITRSVLRTTNSGAYSAVEFAGNGTVNTMNVSQSTLWAPAALGRGVYVDGAAGSGAAVTTLNVHNSVVRGGTFDVVIASDGPANARATATFDHSSVDLSAPSVSSSGTLSTIVNGAGDVAAAPSFANAGAFDFRPAAGSNLIDAGSAPFPATDFNGAAVFSGCAPDIGAYESASGPCPVAVTTLAGIKLSIKAKRKSGKAVVKVTCPATARGTCTGSLKLKQGKKTRSATVKAITPGKTKTLKVKAKKGKATVTVSLTDTSGAKGSKKTTKKLK